MANGMFIKILKTNTIVYGDGYQLTKVRLDIAKPDMWETPTIILEDNTIKTPYVEGVTKYKVYDGNTYLGYFDNQGEWFPAEQYETEQNEYGETLKIKTTYSQEQNQYGTTIKIGG